MKKEATTIHHYDLQQKNELEREGEQKKNTTTTAYICSVNGIETPYLVCVLKHIRRRNESNNKQPCEKKESKKERENAKHKETYRFEMGKAAKKSSKIKKLRLACNAKQKENEKKLVV